MADPGFEIMREHWEGQGDVLVQIDKIAASADEPLNQRIVEHLRRMGRLIPLDPARDRSSMEPGAAWSGLAR